MKKADFPNIEQDHERTVIILDTEGLLSIEKSDEEYDKKLTLFSMACSHIMLINVKGEINSSMRKILSISLYAANHLSCLKHKPTIYFILRDMMDLDKQKQMEMIEGIRKNLMEICEHSQCKLDQVLEFDNDNSFILLPTAFNKESYNSESNLKIDFLKVTNK